MCVASCGLSCSAAAQLTSMWHIIVLYTTTTITTMHNTPRLHTPALPNAVQLLASSAVQLPTASFPTAMCQGQCTTSRLLCSDITLSLARGKIVNSPLCQACWQVSSTHLPDLPRHLLNVQLQLPHNLLVCCHIMRTPIYCCSVSTPEITK